jgi:histidinol dehydrogenase
MRILKGHRELSQFMERLRSRSQGDDPAVEETVRKVLADVRDHGDEAVLKYTRRFDRWEIKRTRLSASQISQAAKKADPNVVKALRVSARRIRDFHARQRESSWSFSEDGSVLGQVIRPIDRVGVYVPGGTAAYPSTVLMNVIPAQVAGVCEIAVCVPSPGGYLNPAVMAAVEMLGVTEVHAIGGAQAIAALAYGTKGVRRVDKIVGPGNIFVAVAKRTVFGVVDIDMIAGPSEILVIADETAPVPFIAADLLSQAEHDEMASSILVTDSVELGHRAAREVETRLNGLSRRDIARKSLDRYGAVIVARDLAHAAELSNRIAPEHLEIMTADPTGLLPAIRHAGAIFLGPWSAEALGDYAAGPNHTLPTGGTARFFSPLGVYDFYKRSSVIGFTEKGFRKIGKTVETLADSEGLEAHGDTVRVRRAAR